MVTAEATPADASSLGVAKTDLDPYQATDAPATPTPPTVMSRFDPENEATRT